ncbi:tRNA uracil 4-sulfurtransferase ThiI [Methanobacterium paludis]|uniref:Probable tRNA sulfurtransferase n=1 Tax=Methanobacterium paludis (strain DSM 25820 / JCM 18151 / SWAN1) TaxID=868131 RepID=F6D357_METPW|nr:tRNA uracil 4-sulfurtransferase ThiI [Methanobacterium paludis]AEG17997.1 tRNA sulfurtransferase [Methanobacterium paludis]
MDKNKPIIVRYGEIGVKSPKVRKRFERKLISNIKTLIDGKIVLEQGRIFLFPENYEEALESLKKICGVVSFSPTVSTETNYDSIKATVQDYIKDLIEKGQFSIEKSFAVKCRRVGTHDFSSREMAGFCGAAVVDLTGAPVDLSNPDFRLFVEVRDDKTYLYHEKIDGVGGLPIGTQGRLIALVSGGIDSPVASYLMMKRGCDLTILNFNNCPYTSGSSEKVVKIYEKLKEYSAGSDLRLYQVNYGDFLKKCKDEAPERMTCVLCKSGMYQIAEKLAKRENALAIVDGSSVGQVASQTLPNILATRYSTSIPVLSPLIGLDKLEIAEIGKKIGTYDISILPDSGCKAAPKHPETNAVLEKVLEVKKAINMDEETEKVFSSLHEIDLDSE